MPEQMEIGSNTLWSDGNLPLRMAEQADTDPYKYCAWLNTNEEDSNYSQYFGRTRTGHGVACAIASRPAVARIWVDYLGDYVRVTITPDRPLYLSGGGATDEGCYYWEEEYWIEFKDNAPLLYCKYSSDSRDCDGRMSREETLACPLHKLAVRSPYDPDGLHPDIKLPQWEAVSYSQQDYAAEAMGY